MDVPPRVAAKSNQAHQPSWRAALRYQHATEDRDKVIAEALGQLAENANIVVLRPDREHSPLAPSGQ